MLLGRVGAGLVPGLRVGVADARAPTRPAPTMRKDYAAATLMSSQPWGVTVA